jgi:GNAT superfamily N-acetyltransferase
VTEVVEVRTPEQFAQVRALLAEYVEFIAGHWPQVDREAFAEEIASLETMYEAVLLALVDGEAAGCCMLRHFDDAPGYCEARRLYVRPDFRRTGVARALMARLMEVACALGYVTMRLVTVRYFTGAIPLYESLGFERVEPYRPSTMPQDVVTFMQRPVTGTCQEPGVSAR